MSLLMLSTSTVVRDRQRQLARLLGTDVSRRLELLNEIEQIEAVLGQSWCLADDDFINRRKEAIALRRRISDHTAAIGRIGEEAFRDSENHESFRRAFSAARSAMAFHHASWPIVSIELDNDDYRASARSMRSAYEAFIAWAKSAAAEL